MRTALLLRHVLLASACSLAACSSDPTVVNDDGAVGSGGALGSGGKGSGGTLGSGGKAGSGGASGTGGAGGHPGFYVSGRFLYDRCGNKVILRGVNEMIVWSPGMDGVPEYAEIAKTGANVVRIVWSATGTTPSALDTTIANALAAKLIPMVENHDATGDITKVPGTVDYWVQSAVVTVLKKYEDKLLLNIANEAGNGSVDATAFENTYKTAISRLRTAGYQVPLVIDAPSWGQDIDRLIASGPTLVQADPLHNILLSTHTYWQDSSGAQTTTKLAQAVAAGIPLIVGEFADTMAGVCTARAYNVTTLMQVAQQQQIGWLAWSWGSVKNSDCSGMFDMTSDGTFNGLQGWGLTVATTDANSIKNTSVRSPYIVNGTCN